MVNNAEGEDRIEFSVRLIHLHSVRYLEFYRIREFGLERFHRPSNQFGIHISRDDHLAAELLQDQLRASSRAAANLETELIALLAPHYFESIGPSTRLWIAARIGL
jgi:hypothetical protein